MAIGKYLSLEEARKKGKLKRFTKEHPSKADRRFWPLLDSIVKGKQSDQETSVQASRGSCSGTQTLSDTSEDTF